MKYPYTTIYETKKNMSFVLKSFTWGVKGLESKMENEELICLFPEYTRLEVVHRGKDSITMNFTKNFTNKEMQHLEFAKIFARKVLASLAELSKDKFWRI